MRLTKKQLKQIIAEQIEGDAALLDAIMSLAGKIDDLDVSIDYLAGAVTDQDPFSVGYSQATSGRLAKPKAAKMNETELKDMVVEELNNIIDENMFTKMRARIKDLTGGTPDQDMMRRLRPNTELKQMWKDMGGRLDTSDKEAVNNFVQRANLDIDVEKYMANIDYAQKSDQLGRTIYSLVDAIALSNKIAKEKA